MASEQHLQTWDRVMLARHPQRPRTLDVIGQICDEFIEFHGDRMFRDDAALIGGLARFNDSTVMVIGQQKGRDTRENLARNFGMVRPEGYRKALRLMRHAAKFQLPILTFVDTPGADPGPKSEEHGQAFAIADCIYALTDLPTPVISVVIGEGGSGGALAIGVADRILMLENAIYSVASPEASASILWKDAGKAAEAAEAMKISALDLQELGIADDVIPEEPPAHEDPVKAITTIGERIEHHLQELRDGVERDGVRRLIDQRRAKLRAIGEWQATSAVEPEVAVHS
ncbi:MAG: acetyl-CoA carboxylase carboxyltransferase subunit alpha [Chloroflexota bacterium]